MVFGRRRTRKQTIELGNSDEVTTQTQSTNYQSRRQEGSTHGARMATGGCCSMGTPISGGRGILEDGRSYQSSGI
jgi:hypothetical protein